MRNFTILSLALVLASSVSACSRSNALPPVMNYPGQFAQQQQPFAAPTPLPGTADLGNGSLPGDVAVGQFGSIVGRVVTRSGRPLHNVQISLQSDPNVRTTTQRGDFTLMNVPVGPQTLVLTFGEVQTTVDANVVPNMAVAPSQNPVQLDGEVGSDALAFANPNRQVAAFKVDQDFLHQWQPVGLEVSGGTLYVSTIDVRNITKKGSVIKMSADAGSEWANLGKALLGLSHPLDSSTRGLALNQSGNLLVTDKDGGLSTVSTSGGVEKNKEAESAIDVAAAAGTVWFSSTRGLESSDDSGSSRSLISGVNASGGVGVDNEGNGYVCSGRAIVKAMPGGEANPIVKNYLNSPADVAIDPRNGDIYVLDSGEIKRFDKNGEFIVSFGSGALDPNAIDLDESGNLYVSDFGRDHRSAQIIKYEAVPVSSSMSSDAGMAAGIAPAEGVTPEGDDSFAEGDDAGFEEIPAGDDLGGFDELEDLGELGEF